MLIKLFIFLKQQVNVVMILPFPRNNNDMLLFQARRTNIDSTTYYIIYM